MPTIPHTPYPIPQPARDAIAAWLKTQRWFGGKGRAIETLRLGTTIPIGNDGKHSLRLLHVEFAGSEEEIYWTAWPTNWRADDARSVVDIPAEQIAEADFLATLWGECTSGNFSVWRHPDWHPTAGEIPPSALATFEQSNTCVLFRPANDEPSILKLYRKLSPGANPDAELGRYLSEQPNPVTPPVRAVLEIPLGGEWATLGILSRFLPGCRTAWDVLLELIAAKWQAQLDSNRFAITNAESIEFYQRHYQEAAAATSASLEATFKLDRFLITLGGRTAQLHNDLAKDASSELVAENWIAHDLESNLQNKTEAGRRQFSHLRQNLHSLAGASRELAEKVLEHESELIARFSLVEQWQDLGKRIRIHGDFHLGQVLVEPDVEPCRSDRAEAGAFIESLWIIDFEGEPSRSLNERLSKRSPLQDVAGMIRSFHYALSIVQSKLFGDTTADDSRREIYQAFLNLLVGAFVNVYRKHLTDDSIVPQDVDAFYQLLDLFILDKALYELGYELNNRPDWVWVPLTGIAGLL